MSKFSTRVPSSKTIQVCISPVPYIKSNLMTLLSNFATQSISIFLSISIYYTFDFNSRRQFVYNIIGFIKIYEI